MRTLPASLSARRMGASVVTPSRPCLGAVSMCPKSCLVCSGSRSRCSPRHDQLTRAGSDQRPPAGPKYFDRHSL